MNSRTRLGEVSASGLGRIRKDVGRQETGFGPSGTPRRSYRTVWISDVHLGTRGCNDRMLIDFLDHVDSEYLYLVGDIIDGWRMKKRFYWPERHNAIVRRVMKRAKRGTKVIYVPGNHDEMFRQFAGMNFGGVEIRCGRPTPPPTGASCSSCTAMNMTRSCSPTAGSPSWATGPTAR
jgi:hypothetical protein